MHCAFMGCPNYREKCPVHAIAQTGTECNQEGNGLSQKDEEWDEYFGDMDPNERADLIRDEARMKFARSVFDAGWKAHKKWVN